MRAVMDAAVYAAVFAAARAVIARILLAEALDRFLDDGDRLVAVRLGDDEGRDEADDVLADGRDEQVTVEAAVLDVDARDRVVELAADEQALAADFLDVGERRELLAQVLADLLRVAGEVTVEELVHLGERRGAADGVAAERRAVGAHREGLRDFLAGADGADRHAAAERFRHGDDVRLDAVVHEAHDLARAAPARLYFVDEEEQAVLIAELPQADHEFLRRGMDAALALYRLEHDGDRVLVAGVLERLEVVVRCVGEAVRHRAEADLAGVARLARRTHGAERAAVEAHLRRDDVVLVRTVVLDAVFARHLDHGLVGLGACALEEDLVHADGLADLLGEQRLRDRVRVVERLHDVRALILHCLDDFFVAVAGAVDGDACVEVEVRRAVLVVHVLVFRRLGEEVETLIRLDHVLLDFGLDVCGGESRVLEFHD